MNPNFSIPSRAGLALNLAIARAAGSPHPWRFRSPELKGLGGEGIILSIHLNRVHAS
ncbi:MAG: hypothetical protein QW520_00350 [Methanomassiliicoccales archaeon]